MQRWATSMPMWLAALVLATGVAAESSNEVTAAVLQASRYNTAALWEQMPDESFDEESANTVSPVALSEHDDELEEKDEDTTPAPASEDTTTTPDDTTTTPAPPESTKSILQHISYEVKAQLDSAEHQVWVAVLALAFGLVMMCDGEDTFNWLLIGAAFLLFCVLAMSEISQVWGVGRHSVISRVVGIEVGIAGAFAVKQSIQGVTFAVGLALGAFIAMTLQRQLVSLGADALEENQGLIVAFYTVIVGVVGIMFNRKQHVRFVIFASSMIGSVLVSSAVSWCVTTAAAKGTWVASAFPDATPKAGTWVDFVLLLVNGAAPDVGIFADSRYNLDQWRTDRIAGVSLAVLLFLGGAIPQLKAMKAKVEARERGGLHEALLSSA